MDVKEAVATAKNYVSELFSNEGISNLGLEEVEFNDEKDTWAVTIAFSRPWDVPTQSILSVTKELLPRRSYKTVHISDKDGRILSVKNRGN